jgi:Zn-dependent protease
LAHIDPLGFLMIFVIQFGWGKPVQINPTYYRRPLRDELMVALAGPASNIILSCISAIIILTLSQTQLSLTSPGLIDFWILFGVINCGMAVFNMLPLPPLDGWRLVKIMVPQLATKFQMLSYQYSWLTFILLFAFVRFV